jgi:8-oxo-dGTP diphosphatase
MIKIKVDKKVKDGAIVVILDAEEKVLLLERPATARWAPYKWGYPGGKRERGETPRQTAIRETKEETRLEVHNLKLLGQQTEKNVVAFYTREFTGDIKIDYEHTAWAWVSLAETDQYDLAPGVLKIYEWVLKNG